MVVKKDIHVQMDNVLINANLLILLVLLDLLANLDNVDQMKIFANLVETVKIIKFAFLTFVQISVPLLDVLDLEFAKKEFV